MIYLGQITYCSTLISRKLFDNPDQSSFNHTSPDTPSRLAQFTKTRIAQSNVHMVQTLKMLESNLDNKEDHKPNTINQAICHPDWPK